MPNPSTISQQRSAATPETHVIPHAALTFFKTAATFLPVFKHAVLRHGLP